MLAPLVQVTRIGSREFLRVGAYAIPIDRIRVFDFHPPGYSGCEVHIIVDDSRVTRGFSGELARGLEELFDASTTETVTHPRDHVTPDLLAELPTPPGPVERIERILDILQDSRSRGHGARIEAAIEALQDLRHRLGGGEATGEPTP